MMYTWYVLMFIWDWNLAGKEAKALGFFWACGWLPFECYLEMPPKCFGSFVHLFISLKLQSQAGLDSSLAAAVDSNIWQWLGGIGRAARSEEPKKESAQKMLVNKMRHTRFEWAEGASCESVGFACFGFPLFKRVHRKKRDTPQYFMVFRLLTVWLWLQHHGQIAISLNLIGGDRIFRDVDEKMCSFKSQFVCGIFASALKLCQESRACFSAPMMFQVGRYQQLSGYLASSWWSNAEGRESYMDEIDWIIVDIAFQVVVNESTTKWSLSVCT